MSGQIIEQIPMATVPNEPPVGTIAVDDKGMAWQRHRIRSERWFSPRPAAWIAADPDSSEGPLAWRELIHRTGLIVIWRPAATTPEEAADAAL